MSESLLEEAVRVRAAATEIASRAQVDAALDRLAQEITVALGASCPILLAVMRGGAFTATAIARRLEFPFEFDYVHLTRYGTALTGGEVDWVVRPSAALEGRCVLIVDDVLDHGRTLAELTAAIEQLEPEQTCSAVLVEKRLASAATRPDVDFVGLSVDDHYLFGCGMDYRGFWRGLPALYAVDAS